MKANSFVDDLVAAMPTPHARLVLVAALAKYSGQSVYIPTESKPDRRVRAAQNMLANGMDSAEAAAAIAARFCVSQRTAQRDVEKARNLSSKNDVSPL